MRLRIQLRPLVSSPTRSFASSKLHILYFTLLVCFLCISSITMRSFSAIGAALLSFAAAAGAVELKVDDEASLKAAISQYANGLMSYYSANASGLPAEEVGYIPKPTYWWYEDESAW